MRYQSWIGSMALAATMCANFGFGALGLAAAAIDDLARDVACVL